MLQNQVGELFKFANQKACELATKAKELSKKNIMIAGSLPAQNDTYVKDEKRKEELFNAIERIPCIKEKADWAMKWIESKDDNFATRLIAFACIEGIFFSGAFCSIYWLKEKGLMQGLTFSNELISRDESLHTEFAILLYSHIKNRLSEEEVHSIVAEAVNIEKEFIIDNQEAKPKESFIARKSKIVKAYSDQSSDG